MKTILLSKYFSRLFWYSVFIVILPVIVLGSFSYYKSSGIALQKVNEGNSQITLQTELRVEQFLKAVDAASMQLVTSPLVNNSLERELSYREFQMIQELREYMQRIQSYDLGIQDVQLINMSQKWIIENSGMYRFDDYAVNMDMVYIKNSKNSFWSASFSNNPLTSTIGKGYGIHLIRKLPLNSQAPTMVVVIKIASGEISKLVENIPGGGKTYVLDENNTVLSSPDGSINGQHFPMDEPLGNIMNQPNPPNTFKAVWMDKDVSVNLLRSSYNDWKYVTMAPIVEVTRESRAIGWITFLICLGIVAAASIITYLHSRRLYRPILKLYEAVKGASDPGSVPLSDLRTQDEFQFISERFQTMKLTQNQMETQMQRHLQQLKDYFVVKLLQGEVMTTDISESLKMFHSSSAWKTKAVLVTQIDTFEGCRFRESDKDLLLFAINNMISDIIPAENRLSPILIHPSQVTLVGSDTDDREAFKNSLYVTAENIQATIRGFLGLKISIGVSRPYSKWSDMPRAYQEGLEALKYRMRIGQEAVIFIEDQQPVQRVKPNYPEAIVGDMLDAIKLLEIERVDELLSQFIKDVFSKECTHQDYQVFSARLLIELIDLANQMGVTWDLAGERHQSLFERLLEMNSASDIEHWFREDIIGKVVEAVEQARAAQDTTITDKVLKIIHESLETDLTLEACAARLHFHPSHVKRVFRRDVGVSFSEYVSAHRLQTAKKWLTQTQMKINEIAERLQYNNAQNFIRYFRKMEGMTPGKYREQYKTWM
ncbi:helix-turn-helix domain-containing protein [Paenibacillus radicis (ex Xue et al. 2023)]|uniref:Helix-turn-helix domain-containing protein n=1 Tax=Paenibacillus radicis (ex Xue et al. 2023) TaxID=2972489 RepID=A0ABT1YH20_9BACL|nr:helix-turn-helix domain-containing protein [Paenibacillus radicis (ex Xue et al. 2023)]MCR8632486.1 helix-turn-helix domain-containing protein [Paenibacillus radicis (ex Xue et al. 2023)]